jgi:arginyl-tRNA synthetase
MASSTMTMTELSSQLAHLGLRADMPEIPAANMLVKPLDIFRSHLANLLSSALGCDISLAYESIGLLNDASQGDLEVIVPRLRLKDMEPSDVIRKVQPCLPNLQSYKS